MNILTTSKTTATADSGRGTGRLSYKIVLGGFNDDGFITRTECIAIADEGPYTPSNTRIDEQVALRFPGFTCLESTYQGRVAA